MTCIRPPQRTADSRNTRQAAVSQSAASVALVRPQRRHGPRRVSMVTSDNGETSPGIMVKQFHSCLRCSSPMSKVTSNLSFLCRHQNKLWLAFSVATFLMFGNVHVTFVYRLASSKHKGSATGGREDVSPQYSKFLTL